MLWLWEKSSLKRESPFVMYKPRCIARHIVVRENLFWSRELLLTSRELEATIAMVKIFSM
jgi:hypothetical protein